MEPKQAAADIAIAIRQYTKLYNRPSVVLVGLSFGGDVVPFIYEKLPADVKGKVKLMVLLSPAKTTDFEVHLSDMAGLGNDNYPNDVIGAVKKIADRPILCVYGDEEVSVFPADFHQHNVSFEKVSGTHHYTDDGGVTALILKHLSFAE